MATKNSSKKKAAKKSAAKKAVKKSAKKSAKKRSASKKSSSASAVEQRSIFEDSFPGSSSFDDMSDSAGYTPPASTSYSVDDEGSSGGKSRIAIIAAILVLVILVFVFRDNFFGGSDTTGVPDTTDGQGQIVENGQTGTDPGTDETTDAGTQDGTDETTRTGTDETTDAGTQAGTDETTDAGTDETTASATVDYTIKPGDTLGKIAASQLGNTARYREIIALNPGLNANALKVGDKIKIPGR